MYVRTPKRRTLGDPVWDAAGGIENAILNWNLWNAPANQFIPGSSWSSYIANAITGKPTQAQLDYNAQQYANAAANMAQVLQSQGVPLPPELDPSTAAAQAASDQQSYSDLIGGTANQNLNAPLGTSITTWAWISLAGIVGLIVLTR